MGVGLRGRRGGRRRAGRARARRTRAHHHRRHHIGHHHHRHHRTGVGIHHHRRRRNRTVITLFSSNHHTSSTVNHTSGQTPNAGCQLNLAGFAFIGIVMCVPGTILTNIGYAHSDYTNSPLQDSGLAIAGPALLAIGSSILLFSAFGSLIQDWKRNTPGALTWNNRIRKDSRTLSHIFELMGLIFSCVGFGTYARVLVIFGCCILGPALILLLVGLSVARFVNFEGAIDHPTTDNTNADPDTVSSAAASEAGTTEHLQTGENPNPDQPLPNTTSTPTTEEDTELLPVQDDLDIVGWALLIPGICYSCVGWIKPYNFPYRAFCGTLGAVSLTIGGVLLITSTKIRLRTDSSPNRSALTRIFVMCLLSGIPLTIVGFINQPFGLALGIAGACLLGIAMLTCICNRPNCQTTHEHDEIQRDPELGQSSNTHNPTGPTSGINQFSTLFTTATASSGYPPANVGPGYPPPGGNPGYPPTGVYPGYPQPGVNPGYPIPMPSPVYPPADAMPSSTVPQPSHPSDDLPNYDQSIPMPTPNFQKDESSSPTAPPPDESYPPHVATSGDNDEDNLPPPPSYEEATIGVTPQN